MTHTPYAPGTLVLVPPCHIHSGGVGIVRRFCLLLAPCERFDEQVVCYDVEVAGDLLWYSHHELRETVQVVESQQEALLAVH